MRRRDRARPASEKGPPEGSRERGARAESEVEATGITNAPRRRERASQAAVPPRGQRKGDRPPAGRARPSGQRARTRGAARARGRAPRLGGAPALEADAREPEEPA